MHPKKRRLASPDSCVESCVTPSAVLKPKKRLVQVLQKWDGASSTSSLICGTGGGNGCITMSTSPSVASLACLPTVPAASDQEQQESLLHRAARTGNLVSEFTILWRSWARGEGNRVYFAELGARTFLRFSTFSSSEMNSKEYRGQSRILKNGRVVFLSVDEGLWPRVPTAGNDCMRQQRIQHHRRLTRSMAIS